MVSEAVAELKGEEIREPAEIKLDLPINANLPSTYVAREDLRLEAYRRLALVTTQREVDDIRDEWVDRYGPLPKEAEALLRVGQLRAECARVGLREATVTKTQSVGIGLGEVARMAPLALKTSQRIRMQRKWPKAIYKEDLGQIILPLAKGEDPAEQLIAFLGAMVPVDEGSLESAAP
jgi:transcription-repair coupling factor (superfamily II helicase)